MSAEIKLEGKALKIRDLLKTLADSAEKFGDQVEPVACVLLTGEIYQMLIKRLEQGMDASAVMATLTMGGAMMSTIGQALKDKLYPAHPQEILDLMTELNKVVTMGICEEELLK